MEWKECTIKDVSILKNGKKRPSSKGCIPVYGGNGIMDYVSESNNKNVIIIGRVGAYCGCVHKCDKECWVSDNAISVNSNDKSDIRFLYYALQNIDIHHHRIGGAQPLMTQDIIGNLSVKIPSSIEDQRRIASILSSLDRKIELNNNINAQLEEVAQAIFKSWFVDFEPFKNGKFVESELGMIPEGWRVGTLSEIIEVKYGKDHKKLQDGKIPVYGSGGLMRHANQALYDKESVLVPRKGTLNNVMYVDRDFWTVDTMFYTIPLIDNCMKYFFLFISKKDLAAMNMGSAVPSMTTAILNSMQIIIPNGETLQRFENVITPLFKKVQINNKESLHLSHLRDTLLPKLMSGEIEI